MTPEEIGRFHGKLAGQTASGSLPFSPSRPATQDAYRRLFPEPERRCVTPPSRDWR